MKLLKFSASWCKPCATLSETLKEFNLCPVEHIDVEEVEDDICERYRIRSIPVMLVVDENGTELRRIQGNVNLDFINSVVKSALNETKDEGNQ